MLGPSWKNKITLKVFSLKHDDPKIFIMSQWQRDKTKPNIVYLLYRIAIGLYFFITWVLSVIDFKNENLTAAFRAKKWIYLTHWGYTICTIQALTSLVMISLSVLSTKLKSHPRLQEKTLKLYKFYRLCNVIATPVAFGITVIYWSVIYNANKKQLDEMNFFVHGSNSIVMLIDLMMVAHPTEIMHFIYPGIFGIIYATFSLIYYFAGGISREGTTYIYTILNWDHPWKTVLISVGVLVFLFVLHVLTWGLHKLRTIREKSEPIVEDSKEVKKGYDNQGMANDVV